MTCCVPLGTFDVLLVLLLVLEAHPLTAPTLTAAINTIRATRTSVFRRRVPNANPSKPSGPSIAQTALLCTPNSELVVAATAMVAVAVAAVVPLIVTLVGAIVQVT